MSYSNYRFPVSLPGEGAGGLTGAWRLKRPVINTAQCTYCGLCDTYCPTSSISVYPKDKRIEISYDYCKGCGLCANICPRKAIMMIEE